MDGNARVIFLHHSTGNCVWRGGVPEWLARYNEEKGTSCSVVERAFPRKEPYGWQNYPYDYWNIWVKNAGDHAYREEPTLEMLTRDYDVIAFKHCFPVSKIQEDTGRPDVASAEKRLENYKLQYAALKEKMRTFPDNRFIVWTAAALVRSATSEDEAGRTKDFVAWVVDEWAEAGDNIFVWDFHSLETEGGLYLKEANARGPTDSHPNEDFSKKAAPSFARRVVDVIEGRGDESAIR